MSEIVTGLVNFFFSLVLSLINLLVTPINNFIINNIPGLSDIINQIGDFFEYIGNIVPWVVSYFGLYPQLINQIVNILTLEILFILFDDAIKFAVKWYNTLKP